MQGGQELLAGVSFILKGFEAASLGAIQGKHLKLMHCQRSSATFFASSTPLTRVKARYSYDDVVLLLDKATNSRWNNQEVVPRSRPGRPMRQTFTISVSHLS